MCCIVFTLTLALSHQGRGDLVGCFGLLTRVTPHPVDTALKPVRACATVVSSRYSAWRVYPALWIPAYAGMTGTVQYDGPVLVGCVLGEGVCGFCILDVAERTGFEPAVSFPTHAFQACPLSRSGTSPRLFYQPLGWQWARLLSILIYSLQLVSIFEWRRGRDSNPRSRLPEIPVFETGAFNHSATSPRT